MKRKDLLDRCKQLGIKGYHNKCKEDLIKIIKQKQMKTSKKKKLKLRTDKRFIDLFCGVGGFHQALDRHGLKCVLACDINKDCREVYETNYKIKPEPDVRKLDTTTMKDFDVLCGGFSCQPFSNAGKKKSFDDERGLLFDEITRIAKVKQPKFMFLENVKHIKKVGNGEVFKYIMHKLDITGYKTHVYELSPHQLGVPQQRERVIFACIRKDIYDETKDLSLDVPECEIDFTSFFEKDEAVKEKYRIKPDVEKVLDAWDEMIQVIDEGDKLSPTILVHEFYRTYTKDEFDQLPNWKRDYMIKNKPIYEKYKEKWDTWYEKHKELLQKREIYGKLEWQAGKKKKDDSIWNYFIQLRQSGIRVKKAKYFPTLVAMVQVPIYGKERRYITPRECARLQSFPDSFILHEKDHQSYRQFGNAVNVDVVDKVMSLVLKKYDFIE